MKQKKKESKKIYYKNLSYLLEFSTKKSQYLFNEKYIKHTWGKEVFFLAISLREALFR